MNEGRRPKVVQTGPVPEEALATCLGCFHAAPACVCRAGREADLIAAVLETLLPLALAFLAFLWWLT